MKSPLKAVAAFIAGVLLLLSMFAPAAGQGATGTVSVQVWYCPSLAMAQQLTTVPANCSPGPGQFSFYLIGDGTADYELLDVPLSGSASIDLPVGDYEVWEENTGVNMTISVNAGQTTPILFGIPSEAGPETPSGEFYISAWACPSVSNVEFVDVVPGDCVRIATHMSFYLIGDGTDAHYPMPTLATGAMRTSLPLGDYEVVHEPTQVHLFMTVSENTGDVHLVVPSEAEPEPATGELYISTWACPGVSVVSYAEVVPADCVRIATNLSFYLMGDGTDTYYSVYTVTTGAAQATLPIGMYEVVDEFTQAHVYVTIEAGTNEAHIVYPKTAPAVTPAPTAAAQPTAAPKPATVTKLPSTGSGPESSLATMGVVAAGAVAAAGAIGMRVRKN